MWASESGGDDDDDDGDDTGAEMEIFILAVVSHGLPDRFCVRPLRSRAGLRDDTKYTCALQYVKYWQGERNYSAARMSAPKFC